MVPKALLQFFLSLLSISHVHCNTWTWVSGNRDGGSNGGSYGVVRSIGEGNNTIGQRERSAIWTHHGGVYIFGGVGFDSSNSYGVLNDFWNYQNGSWMWVSGNDTRSAESIKGTTKIPHIENSPSAREGPLYWSDSIGNLWLFGGLGRMNGDSGGLDDLWMYYVNGSGWAFQSGSSSLNAPPNYNLFSLHPGCRRYSTIWTDYSNQVWLFGGYTHDSDGHSMLMGDLWGFTMNGQEWKLAKRSTPEGSAVWGEKGVPSPTNFPPRRYDAMGWFSPSGDLMLFGGRSTDRMNDLWKFHLSLGEWEWVKGPDTLGDEGNYGTKFISSPSNNPSGRFGANILQRRDNGAMIMQGGRDVADVWTFDGVNWIWIGGENSSIPAGNWEGNTSTNFPASRRFAATTCDENGVGWMFGGRERSEPALRYNDLLSYVFSYGNAMGNLELTSEDIGDDTTVSSQTVPTTITEEKESVSLDGGGVNVAILSVVLSSVGLVILGGVGSLVLFLVVRKLKKVRYDTERVSLPNEDVPIARVEDLNIKRKIGKGEFGDIFLALSDGTPCAAKKLSLDNESFMKEASMLSKLSHPNIVQFIGIHESNVGERYLVLEFISGGSLLSYLDQHSSTLEVTDLVKFARDILKGMVYLERKNIFHRDLAARNVLIDDKRKLAKVSDFGLSKSGIYASSSSKVPIRWSAPEVLNQQCAGSKSDVFSYGVLLWELPFTELSNDEASEIIRDKSKPVKLQKPSSCPVEIYEIMLRCWQHEPDERPSFAVIRQELQGEEKEEGDEEGRPIYANSMECSENSFVYNRSPPSLGE